jgi:exosortase
MALGYPLQRVATLASNYALQTLGLPAAAEGNVIHIDKVTIGVVEACNGLGMLFTFIAFAVGTALIVRRHTLDKVLIILSAVPIALAANVTRITVTGLLHVTAGSELAEHVYHDLAGWLMMPLAVGSLWLELLIISHLFLEESETRFRLPAGTFEDPDWR